MKWAAATRRAFSFLTVSRPRDRGSSMVEVGAALALVAVVTAAAVAAVPGRVGGLVDSAVCSVHSCEDGSASPAANNDGDGSKELLPSGTPAESPSEGMRPREYDEHTILCFRAPCP